MEGAERVQVALEMALETGNEMDAHEYLADINVGEMSVAELIQHAKELYPDDLDDRLDPKRYDDCHAALQEIASILLTGYEDEEDEEEEEEEGDYSSSEYIPVPKRRRCLNPISLNVEEDDADDE